MSIIKVENLSKKYIIGHDRAASGAFKYQSLRDSMTHWGRGLYQRLRHPLSPNRESTELEEFWALKDINFEIQQGDRVGIIGRNGAGKSTLLKILSRITEPTTGKITMNGRVASLLEVGTGFHPELTGRENIYLNGAILGMSRIEIKKKFDEIVAFAEVEKFLDTPVKHYSSGMYVRLAFAVAAHLEPEILLVDEVLAVGDAQFQKKCLGKMEDVSKEGRTIIFVSHNMGAVKSICNKAIWIANGQLKQTGCEAEICAKYEQATRSYLGIKSEPTIRQNIKNHQRLHLSAVHILDSNGNYCNEFKYLDEIIIALDLEGNIEGGSFIVEFRIWNNIGQLLTLGSSGVLHGKYYPSDTRKVFIKIPHIPLADNEYFISFDLVHGNIRLDTWFDATKFTIIECFPFERKFCINEPICIVDHIFS